MTRVLKDTIRADFLAAINEENISLLKTLTNQHNIVYYFISDDKFVSAITTTNLEIVNLILEKITDVEDLYLWFYTACEKGQMNIIRILIDRGFTNWNKGLEAGSKNGQVDVVKLMLEKGADEIEDALTISILNGHLEIVKLLIVYPDIDVGDLISTTGLFNNQKILNFLVLYHGRIPKDYMFTFPKEDVYLFYKKRIIPNTNHKLMYSDLSKIDKRASETLKNIFIPDILSLVLQY